MNPEVQNYINKIVGLWHELSRQFRNIKNIITSQYNEIKNIAKQGVKKLIQWRNKLKRVLHWDVYTLIFGYLLIVFLAMEDRIYNLWIDWLGKYMAEVYDLLGHAQNLNYITFIALAGIIAKLLMARLKDIYVSINKIIIATWILLILIRCKSWIYLDAMWKINYKSLLYLGIILYLFITCYKIIIQLRRMEKKKNASHGFVTETSEDKKIDVGWRNYATSLVTRFLNTDISEGVFSVGVSGSWGAGKTSFLKEVEKQLDKKAFIVRFNPWNSQNPNQIITDYFNTLKEALSPFYSTLSLPLTQYANLLTQLEIENWATKLTKHLISQTPQDLNSLKNQVENCIVAFNKPVIVLIDDLDRLEKDELFEVLRLIRNTAQFRNMIYIVTYDRQHVIEMLTSTGVESSQLYIEKIFDLEISLPSYENYILPVLLERELNKMLPDEEIRTALREHIYRLFKSQYIITYFLKNFRGVKRFANTFVSDLNNLITLNHQRDIYIPDFFWLELIHYVNPDFYQLLRNRPEELFVIDKHAGMSNASFYFLGKKTNNALHPTAYTFETFDEVITKIYNVKKPEEPFFNLLEILFGYDGCRINKNKLRYVENYQKYFAFRMMKHQISSSDFYVALKNPDSVNEKIKMWSQQKKNLSLAFYFDSHPTGALNLEDAKLFLGALITWGKYGKHSELPSIINRKMTMSAYNKKLYHELATFVKDQFTSAINDNPDRENIASILSKLYVIEIFDPMDDQEQSYNSLLTNENIKELAHENCLRFLEHHPSIDPLDIIRSGSELNKLADKSYAWTYGPDDIIYGVNLIYEDIKGLFIREKKPEYKKIMNHFSMPNLEGLENEADYQEKLQQNIERYFSTLKNYKIFVKECIDIPDEEKVQYFKSIGINSVTTE